MPVLAPATDVPLTVPRVPPATCALRKRVICILQTFQVSQNPDFLQVRGLLSICDSFAPTRKNVRGTVMSGVIGQVNSKAGGGTEFALALQVTAHVVMGLPHIRSK